MKTIEKIKQELIAFGKKYRANERRLESIEGDTLTELFGNIDEYVYWCKDNEDKVREFNNIFGNELVIENGVLLCNCSNLTCVTIPNSVTSIGKCAFNYCTGLSSVTILNSATSIGGCAFLDCHPELEIIRK